MRGRTKSQKRNVGGTDLPPLPELSEAVLDADGHLIPLTPEEHRASVEAAERFNREVREQPDTDPPGTAEEMMRAIDSRRSPGNKLFEGMY